MKLSPPTFLILALACAPAVAQQSPAAASLTPDQATYQTNAPVLAPTTPPPGAPTPPGSQTAASAAVGPVSPPAIPSAGTAREQGLITDTEIQISPWDAETLRRRESPRQRGEQAIAPSRKNGVATDPSMATWVAAWEARLVSIGVHPEKVKFEGRRLTKDQFALWASRQVWAVEAGLIAP